mmetsp:Transcript_87472/g.246833  ORF Transcript_87472/g.246833 Transcript_87472/m.246833 type:complete len:205 (-) Transcript_87472:69-683(-)
MSPRHPCPLSVAVLVAIFAVTGEAAFLRQQEQSTAASWGSLTAHSNSRPGCPVDYDVPLDSGAPSPLHVASVNNFIDDVDRWWTEKCVEKYYTSDSAKPYKIAPSPISGCGLRATRFIKQGERIGPVWVPDNHLKFMVHFTPWFGRAVNHCPISNTFLERDSDRSVWTVASRDIRSNEELTGNYNEAHSQFPKLVEGADPAWTC